MTNNSADTPARYDLLLRGGRVIDPAQGREGMYDIAITGGRVVAVERKIPRGQAAREIACAGQIVTPGLIDMHAHGYWGATMIGIQPDPLCRRTGVTTFVDTGSAGADNFTGFRHFIIERSRVRIVPLLHVCSIGLINQGVGELLDNRYVDLHRVVQTVTEHRDLIAGVKIRLGDWVSGANTQAGFAAACEARDAVGLPLMVHAVGQPVPLGYVLDRLKPGDILTHCFNGRANGLLGPIGPERPDWLEHGGEKKVIPEAWAARERGVRFDVGHGLGSFSWEVAQRAVEQGFLPDTLGTDVYSMNINGQIGR